MAQAIADVEKDQEISDQREGVLPERQGPEGPATSSATPISARMLRKLVEAEKEAAGKGRHEALQGRARSLL